MRAIYVEFEADPIVFEIRSAGESRKRDVIVAIYGVEDASKLQVHVQPVAPAAAFRFEAGTPVARRPSNDPSDPVRVAVPLTCSGGEEGKEEETRLTLVLEYPGQDPATCSVRLVASANRVLPLWQVLAEEYAELKEGWRDEIRNNTVLQDPQATDRRKLQEVLGIVHTRTQKRDGLAALCFSGGGIRSATFNLGTLQGLAAAGLLPRFDYVSSVSGGGYLSSWLAGWLHRAGQDDVERGLAQAQSDPERPEAVPIRALRQYSNYLTPKLGALSGDTWTVASIVIRNLLLNLLVMLPLLAAILAVPLLAVVKPYGGWSPRPEALYWLSVGLGTLALFFMSLLRASAKPRSGWDSDKGWDQRFLLLGLVPLLLSTILMAWAVARFAAQYDLEFVGTLRWSVIWSLVSPVVAFVLSILLQGRMLHRERAFFKGDLIALLLSGSVVTVIYAAIVGNWAEPLLDSPYPLYPVLAPILYLGPMLLGKTLFVAISSFAEEKGYPSDLGDADREWWARWSGYVLIAAVLWMVFSAAVLFGPSLLGLARNAIGSRITTAGVTGVLGWIISLLGKSSQTSAKESGSSGGWRNWVLALAAPLFCLAVLLLVAAVTQDLLRLVFGSRIDYDKVSWVPPFQGEVWQVLAAIVVLGAFGVVMGRFVNVNRFSLQAMYRNRLVRAYLGASNSRRRPNLFTGFDPEDNLRMHELRENRPFPVVNIALNLVSGKELAWQQRKAENFTSTALHCGSARLGYRRSQAYGGGQGISLGTAVATSGAAANPSMGYHSSPAVTFIMTLFNARLGVWLGNPGPLGAASYTRGGPRSSALVLLSEALGQTDSEHPYVNLSDGGHFENLGIYEMVRRRCRYIVACDAGGDPACAFEDLGNAIRKIRIDFGIPIDFEDRVRIYSKAAVKADARYCAIGRIRYSAVDGDGAEDGTLIYLKPAVYESRYEPYDVYNYARSSADFPHETTADQWFSESQFESYRALGEATMRAMIGWDGKGRPPQLGTLEELEGRVRDYLKTQPVAPLPGPGGNGQDILTPQPPAGPAPLATS